ncbi:MAG: STAS domain-containing protein [Anaerolineales bacterium]|jgi:anti-anti-sigma factor
MRITISKKDKPISVTILHLEGKLDRANYENLIDEAQDVYDNGARDLILDLSKLTFISSAGVAALHQVALLYREEKHPRLDGGWGGFRSENRDRSDTVQEHVKLFSPPGEVRELLNLAGFGLLFEIFTDLSQAVDSFRQPAPELGDR